MLALSTYFASATGCTEILKSILPNNRTPTIHFLSISEALEADKLVMEHFLMHHLTQSAIFMKVKLKVLAHSRNAQGYLLTNLQAAVNVVSVVSLGLIQTISVPQLARPPQVWKDQPLHMGMLKYPKRPFQAGSKPSQGTHDQ